MRWRRTAFWVTFSVLTLVVLTLGWLWTADLGVFKPQVERLVTQKTGRSFVIDGQLSIDLAGSTTIIAEGVRFANPGWADSEHMITIGRAEVRIDLWSLVRGPVLIELIDLNDTNIQLLNPGDKPPNWKLRMETAPERDANNKRGLGMLFEHIDIDRLQLHFESAQRDRPLQLAIERFEQVHREDDHLDLSVRGSLDGRSIEIDGEFGTWGALLAGKNFAADIDATLDTVTLSARGRVDDIAELRRPELEITASGPDIDHLTRMLGLGEADEGGIELFASLAPIEDGPLVLELEGHLGSTEIDIQGQVADLQSLRDMKLRATASGPDLGHVLRLGGITGIPEAPFMLSFDTETLGKSLVVNSAQMDFADAKFGGSATLPHFPSIDDAVIRLQIEGTNVERFRFIPGMPGAASGPFSLGFSVDVRDDGAEVAELEANTSFGNLRGSGLIPDPDTLLGTRFDVHARIDSLSTLAAAYGLDDMPDRPAEISGSAEYTKAGIRTDGPIMLNVDGNSAETEGLIGVQPGLKGTDLAVTAAGDDFSRLVALFASPAGVPALPFDLRAKLRVGQDGVRLTDIDAAIGTTGISGDGLVVPGHRIAGSWFNVIARGTDFEQLFESMPDVRVRPGPFELNGRIDFQADAIEFNDVRLKREAGNARADLVLGVGGQDPHFAWDIAAEGMDVRAVLGGIGEFEAFPQPFSVATRGTWRGTASAVDRLEITIGEARLTGAGALEFVDAATVTEVKLDLVIPSLADVGTINGRRFRDQSISASARIKEDNSTWSIQDLDMRIGESNVYGTVFVRKGDVPDIDIEVASDRLVYHSLLEDIEEDAAPRREFEGGRVIPDISVPFDALTKVNGSVAATIAEFQQDNLYLSDAALDATLRDGVVDIHDFRFRARSGQLAATASLVPETHAGKTTLQVVGRNLAFGLAETNLDLATKIDLDANLQSSGTTLRDLAGNTNGVVYVDIRGGLTVHNKLIQAVYGNMLEEILNTINPFRATDPHTDIECVIVPLTLTDGRVAGAPSVFMSTSKIRLLAQPEVDLNSEQLQATVRTTPRRMLSVSAAELVNPYVQIEGTLAAPRLGVDEAGMLMSGGAAVATGGLSLVARGLWARLSQSGDACGQASKQALKELAGRMPDIVLESPPQTE
jgi:uncharacterized protein involved in outer membrane biogenesis